MKNATVLKGNEKIIMSFITASGKEKTVQKSGEKVKVARQVTNSWKVI